MKNKTRKKIHDNEKKTIIIEIPNARIANKFMKTLLISAGVSLLNEMLPDILKKREKKEHGNKRRRNKV